MCRRCKDLHHFCIDAPLEKGLGNSYFFGPAYQEILRQLAVLQNVFENQRIFQVIYQICERANGCGSSPLVGLGCLVHQRGKFGLVIQLLADLFERLYGGAHGCLTEERAHGLQITSAHFLYWMSLERQVISFAQRYNLFL